MTWQLVKDEEENDLKTKAYRISDTGDETRRVAELRAEEAVR